ncbi:MAG: carbohydrate porin [Burkholderiaceae bacterium]|jgi:carbohydrate-selective porin OprB|nr:carbohydrate porin [Burkholderiaceae bacterium]
MSFRTLVYLFFAQRPFRQPALTLCAWLALTPLAQAQEAAPENFALHGQGTYIWQRQPSFHSPYEGVNSLSSERGKSYSASLTLDIGWRPWRGAELHLNPEIMQGVAFSGLRGLGGMSNGELAKVTSSSPKAHLSGFFLRQTWDLEGESESLESDFNQLAGRVGARRVVLTAGKVSALDAFGHAQYAHDTRTQFFNGAFMTHGSFDYPADALGYTWGAALSFITPGYALHAGRFAQPVASNGQAIDLHLSRHYGDMLGFEKRYTLSGQPGTVRLLLWRNKARMGAFDDAVRWGAATGDTPDLAAVRQNQAKRGVGVSVEQALNDDVTVFAGAGLSDDRTETYAFTEIGRDFTAGALIRGGIWGRPKDTLGIGLAVNALGRAHRDYLAAGGLGAFLGDGRLNYGRERIVELFYAWQLNRYVSLSPDFQLIRNPGYNRDRGPVRFYGLRLHAEF